MSSRPAPPPTLPAPALPAPVPTQPPAALEPADRVALVRRARLLAWVGFGWHAVEATVAIAAGIAAGTIALIGFGADSVIEAAAGIVVLWLVARSFSARAERRAQQLIAVSFFVLAAYVAIESLLTLADGRHPQVSWVGIGLAAVTLATMPPLAIAKSRVGQRLGSSAAKSEARQNMICAALSGALLLGLGANAAFGWWWADPAAGLVVALAAVREGRGSWRGDNCCTAPSLQPGVDCGDECCR